MIINALDGDGVPHKQARGAARGVLGNALETSLTWSANIRAIRNVIEQRAHPAADAEIREFGIALLAVMKQEAPVLFADYTESDSPDGLGKYAEARYRKV
jgi:thymidylate synthase (FAD)